MALPNLFGAGIEAIFVPQPNLFGVGFEFTEPIPTMNLIIKDINGGVLENAEVFLDGVSKGVTGVLGDISLIYELNTTLELKIVRSGFQDYTSIFNEKEQLDWQITIDRIVPVVITGGVSLVNTNPTKAANQIFN